MSAYRAETQGEGLGDVFSDRIYREWPVVRGGEITEVELRASYPSWPTEGAGDVFSDRVFGEWPRMLGYEVTEETEE